MLDVRGIQQAVGKWADANFGVRKPHQPLLGLAEELGELSHAHLKGEQGIRHSPEEIRAMAQDAIGDLVIYLADYCYTNGYDLEEAIAITWSKVMQRDWVTNPLTGGEASEEAKGSGTQGVTEEIEQVPAAPESEPENPLDAE